ncbi:hypothetical protein EZV62_012690 [Acer yangbiense]|uniref:Pentacotripeptide-repeat region of PRORP domain-containing protein n=1 Tax=Acer yangbiense TaxID=1000413 RepID=A0A5C7HW23_9ROSI|nr:hypothetical protein EZV62_012690 [Acer yangbiense]
MVFEELPEKDVMTWTALIVGLAMCGEGNKALDYFHEMQITGVKPDAITFVGVLPSIERYGCLVDVLGRAGRIAEAEELIRNMPMAPDHFVLGGLLGACRIHGNLKAAERVAQQLLELYPENDGAYVILSNIYSSSRKWHKVKRTRELMAKHSVKKLPGCVQRLSQRNQACLQSLQ